ncbi:MAG: DUF4416 family protein [candidate division Zixibacteria bacterium]
MTKKTNIEPVKLFAGFIYSDIETLKQVLEILENKFGPVEFESEHFDFSHTVYYKKEMGADLKRLFVSFEKPVMPDNLKDIKNETNSIERKFVNADGGRLVNIDPGLIGLANVILASTKEYSHRIYLGNGIFGEITLLYEDNSYRPLKWTYPDYRTADTIDFLQRVRESLKDFIIKFRQ